jgi:ligand-binding sensor domain-containing protein
LGRPSAVSAIAFMGGRLYAADTTGVFELEVAQPDWQRISSLSGVVDLAAGAEGHQLFATSATQGVEYLEDGRWHATDSLASPHQHHAGNESHPEVLSLTPVDGRLYAVGTAFGVSASADAGQTWSQLGGGLENVTPAQLVDYQGALVAATSNGVFRFRLDSGMPASPAWWLVALAAVVAFGIAGVMLAGFDRLPRLRSRQGVRNR